MYRFGVFFCCCCFYWFSIRSVWWALNYLHLSFILCLCCYHVQHDIAGRWMWMWMWICVHYPFGCIKYVWTVSFVSVYFSRCRRRLLVFVCGCCLYRSVFHRNLINFPCNFYLWLFNEHVATPSICFNKLLLPAKLLISCSCSCHTAMQCTALPPIITNSIFGIQCAIDLKMSQ